MALYEQGSEPEHGCSFRCRLLRLRHVVDVVPALSVAAEITASRTDLESYILRLTVQVHRTATMSLRHQESRGLGSGEANGVSSALGRCMSIACTGAINMHALPLMLPSSHSPVSTRHYNMIPTQRGLPARMGFRMSWLLGSKCWGL